MYPLVKLEKRKRNWLSSVPEVLAYANAIQPHPQPLSEYVEGCMTVNPFLCWLPPLRTRRGDKGVRRSGNLGFEI
jgi:hypothetical protein